MTVTVNMAGGDGPLCPVAAIRFLRARDMDLDKAEVRSSQKKKKGGENTIQMVDTSSNKQCLPTKMHCCKLVGLFTNEFYYFLHIYL